MKRLLLLPLLLGLMSPAIAHNEFNGGCDGVPYCDGPQAGPTGNSTGTPGGGEEQAEEEQEIILHEGGINGHERN